VLLASLLIVGGLSLTIYASGRAVTYARLLVADTGLSPFVIGMLLLAVGTDLPEMAHSVAAAVTGRGDILAGDSIGSAFTQSTLILGLLPLIGGIFAFTRSEVGLISGSTVGALLVSAALMADGRLSRIDGAALIALWMVVAYVAWRLLPVPVLPPVPADSSSHRGRDTLRALIALLAVGAGALAAVEGLVLVSDELGIPQFVAGFFIAALGTSLPELVVNATALRRGSADMAVGGLLGASLLDSSVSIGVGPLVAPVAVTASLVVPGALWTALGLLIVTLVLVVRRRHDRASAALFILLYAAFIPVLGAL
jgi:cation:H+ antiporter